MEARVLHRRLIAMVVGVLVAMGVVAATFALLPAQSAHEADVDYGYVYAGAKSSSVDFIRAAMGDDALLVLGSSEFSTPARLVPEVPVGVFGTHDYGVRPMLVGEAFDQCLWHAMALGALARDGLPRNKVALIVGLGQFTDGGLDASTFKTRFSYTMYQAFCNNPAISPAMRGYVATRLEEQGIDATTIRAGAPANALDAIDGVVLGVMDDLRLRKDLIDVRLKGIPLAGTTAQEGQGDTRAGEAEQPNWDALRAQALADAQRMSTTNDWGLEDAFYTEQLEPALDSLKDARASETYTNTPEYDDLDFFLQVCEACGVEALVIVQPSCGPYYDHIGISAATREAAYQRIRNVVDAHGSARIADFSSREYEPYFLYDIVHFGWTGWVEAERALYEFATSA